MQKEETLAFLSDLQSFFKQQKIQYGDYVFQEEYPDDIIPEIIIDGGDIKKEKKAKPESEESIDDNLFEKSLPVKEKITEKWEKAVAVDELNSMICNCQKCPLGKTRTKFVFGVGNPNADIMFIGEAPGADEDAQGEPFVGRAGQLFNKILDAIAWKREDVFICNILKCRPPNNRDPLASEVEQCEPYLIKQIELVKPILMVSLGRIAAQTLLRKPTDSLGSMRNKTHTYANVPLIVTFHPAALLRNPNWKPDAWEDFKRIKSMYENATNKKLK
jgi:uracil-DNA glycosylase